MTNPSKQQGDEMKNKTYDQSKFSSNSPPGRSDAHAEHACALAAALRGGIATHLQDHPQGATLDEFASRFNARREFVQVVVDGLILDRYAELGADGRVVAVTA